MDRKELQNLIDSINEMNKDRPIRVKVNEEWLKWQVENDVIKRSNFPVTAMGIPLEIDNRVKTFEFVYEEEKNHPINK